MKVLVTGAAGFIGSHLVERLVRDGHDVVGFDNFANGFASNVEVIRGNYDFVEGDIRDREAVDRVMQGVEVVFHEGALGSVPRSIADPATSFDVNVMGTLTVLTSARDAGVRRVVYASSSSVYGDTTVSPKHEELTPNPLSPYAITKLSAEQSCGVFTKVYGLETVSLRYFNVFGPRQNPFSQYAAVVPKFLTALARGERPTVFGDGEQSRGFTYVDNVVNGNLLAMDAPHASGRVINLASPTTVTVNAMLRQMGDLLGVDPNPDYVDPRPGDIRDSLADISLARTVLGFEPTVTFEEGLARTVEAFQRVPATTTSTTTTTTPAT